MLQNEQTYKNVILHEVGHALGWHGHSREAPDVMYKEEKQANVNLTNRDVEHVLQVKGY